MDNDTDRYCRLCGYNLRGLSGDSVRCPECGKLNPPCTRYAVVSHFWRFGLHFSVLDDARRRVFGFRARQFTLGRNFDLTDARGETLLRVVQRHTAATISFKIMRDGQPVGIIMPRGTSIRRHRFELDQPDNPGVECVCAGRRWEVRREGEFVAEVNKPWFAWLYSGQQVEIAQPEDTPLILATILAIRTVLGRA